MNLLALAREGDDTAQVGGDSDHRVVTRMDDLVTLCGSSRATVRRMLAELEERGVCRVSTKTGRAATVTVILGQFLAETLASFRPPETPDNQDACGAQAPPPAENSGQISETVHGRVIPLFPDGDLPPVPPARADLDLLRSSDQISGSEDLSRSSRSVSPAVAQIPAASDWPPEFQGASKAPGTKKSHVDLTQIPERAWAAADYLRSQVLAQHRTAVLGAKPWDPGWAFDGQARRIGDGSRTGLRLSWADEFRSLHARVHRARLNAGQTTPEQTWDEVSRTVHWLFHGQQADPKYRLVVESPGSLTTKWDAIQNARRRQQADVPRRADGKPDPRARREIKLWTGQE